MRLRKWHLVEFLMLLLAAPRVHAGAVDSTACAGILRVPLRLEFTSLSGPPLPGSAGSLRGRMWADANVDSIRVDLTGQGSLSLASSPHLELGALAAGDSLDFNVSVQYGSPGFARLDAAVEVAPVDPTNFGVFNFDVLLRTSPYRSMVGRDGEWLLAFAAVDADSIDGLIPPSAADSLRQDLLHDTTLAEVDSTGGSDGPQSALANVTISGTVNFADKNGNRHAVPHAKVEVRDKESNSDRLIIETTTNLGGFFTVTVPNDDGFLFLGLDVFIRVFTEGPYVQVRPYKYDGGSMDTQVVNNVKDNLEYIFTINVGPDGYMGSSWQVLAAANFAAEYAKSINGGEYLPQVVVEFPMATIKRPNGKKYDTSNFDDGRIHIKEKDRYDWDVISHEYGHYYQARMDITANPGGPHSKPCLSVEQGSKERGVKMAWAEGMATFFGVVGQRVLNLGDMNIPDVGDRWYDDGEDARLNVSLESQGTHVGEDSEFAVARAFWDLWDSDNDDFESIAIAHTTLWDRVKAVNAKTLSGAWAKLRAEATAAQDLGIADVAANHHIAPRPNVGVVASTAVLAQPTLSWSRGVGCSNNLGSRFNLVFFRPGNPPTALPRIASLQNLAVTSRTLTDAEAFDIFAGTGDGVALYAIEGSNTSGPATGPYMGNRAQVEVTLPIIPVTLAQFDVYMDAEGIDLQWRTGPGSDDLSFDVARGDEAVGPYELRNDVPIHGDRHRYVFRDRDLEVGRTYWYRLEAHTASGERIEVGVRAVRYELSGPAFTLSSAEPNPFAARTSVQVHLTRAAVVNARVHDVAGRVVRDLTRNTKFAAGRNEVIWDGRDARGHRAAAGIYFLRVQAAGRTEAKRVVLMR